MGVPDALAVALAEGEADALALTFAAAFVPFPMRALRPFHAPQITRARISRSPVPVTTRRTHRLDGVRRPPPPAPEAEDPRPAEETPRPERAEAAEARVEEEADPRAEAEE